MNTPNTPQELINQNQEMEELSWVDKMMREVCDNNPSETLELSIRMLQVLLKFHCDGVQHYMEQGEMKNSYIWMKDGSTIDNCITLLKEVEL